MTHGDEMRDRVATILREWVWSLNRVDLPDAPGEVADQILALVRGEGSWGWRDGFQAGREWMADVVQSIAKGEDL